MFWLTLEDWTNNKKPPPPTNLLQFAVRYCWRESWCLLCSCMGCELWKVDSILAPFNQSHSRLFWVKAWECNCSEVDSILALVTQWHCRPFWGNRSEFSSAGVELSTFFSTAVIFNLLTEPLHFEFSHSQSHKHKQVSIHKEGLTHTRNKRCNTQTLLRNYAWKLCVGLTWWHRVKVYICVHVYTYVIR